LFWKIISESKINKIKTQNPLRQIELRYQSANFPKRSTSKNPQAENLSVNSTDTKISLYLQGKICQKK
jgi:hypothetical protein